MIKFRCHKCNKKIGVQEGYAGCRVWCPRCGIPTTVPETGRGETNMENAKENTQYSVAVYHGMDNEEDASIIL